LSKLSASFRKLLIVVGVALVWLAAFKLNALLFTPLQHSERAHWIFLPASLRILSVLLFDEAGVIGLMIGAYLTLGHGAGSGPLYEIPLAMTSGLAPLVAIWLCRRLFPIAHDLHGLRPLHIVLLSIAGAVANSVILNAYLAVVGRLNGDLTQLATIFVGDLLGTAIVLFVLTALLSLATPRPITGN